MNICHFAARNPPPICVGVPHLEKEASVCLDFYDLDISKKTFSGCVKAEAVLFHVVKEEIKLGCFSIPLAKHQLIDNHFLSEQQKFLKVMETLAKIKRNQLII